MTANDSKSYFPDLNKLLYQCNNTYNHYIDKKYIKADYSASTENIESNLKALKVKVNDRVTITSRRRSRSIRIFLAKIILEIGQGEYLSMILLWKLILECKRLKI